jgi:hypothetical protein
MQTPGPLATGLVAVACHTIVAFLLSEAMAQSGDGSSYVSLPLEREIALARSAAPPEISAEATVWALDDGEFRIAIEGTNGNHCFVGRSTPHSLEPVCYDAEAAATVLLWEFEYFRLRTNGATKEEIEGRLAGQIESGALRVPARPAMSYMMSSAQHLFDPDTGRDVGNWKPHLMLYIPGLTEADIGLAEPTSDLGVFRPGTRMAHLIIVVPDFVEPRQ